MSNRVELPPKLVGETATYTFDFTSRLAATETISAQSVTVAVYSGTDATPSSLLSGSASASGHIVSQKLIGGTLGVIYEITCQITSSLSQILQLTGYLAIIPKVP
jgi:flagellar biosynthesis protein FliR